MLPTGGRRCIHDCWHRGTSVESIAWHLTFRLEVDRDIAPSSAERRILARTVARPFPMLAFRSADKHGHVLTMGGRRRAAELARRIEIALQKALKPGVCLSRQAVGRIRKRPAHTTTVDAVLGQLKARAASAVANRSAAT